ncbi:GNAT family N-acetyltransferase [Microbacterium sp. NPDC058389]|uniref:GNAT family N-acetyltransferase n=1 Tax=Microbacterium sp. NPDC058389 TaxID=3346475 RepID=UPI00365CEF4D
MSSVLVRCDATARGGIGHFVRAVALAEELTARGRRVFVSGDVSAPLAMRMLSASAISMLPPAASSPELLALARSVGAGVVHIDGYEGFDDVRAAAAGVGGPVVSTATDADHGRRAADVIVDGSPRALRWFDGLYRDADVCLGPDFLPLRSGLTADSTRAAAAPDERGLSVLVMMGGTDAAGYGPAAARSAASVDGVRRVGLVGAEAEDAGVVGVPHDPDLTALVDGWDVVITAAGTTVWELAALSVPMALIGVAENQRDHYDTLCAEGAAIGLGFMPAKDALDASALAALLVDDDARRAITRMARGMVDGHGAARVVDAWDGVARDRRTASLELRPAELRDAGRLYGWREDPATRAQSRNTEPIPWGAHVAWLRTTLRRPDRRLFVAAWRGPVGTVRLDELSPGAWEISITVAPHERGRGVGGRMIEHAIAEVAGAGGDRVVAELRDSNDASRALFRSAGFVHEDARAAGWERWVRSL